MIFWLKKSNSKALHKIRMLQSKLWTALRFQMVHPKSYVSIVLYELIVFSHYLQVQFWLFADVTDMLGGTSFCLKYSNGFKFEYASKMKAEFAEMAVAFMEHHVQIEWILIFTKNINTTWRIDENNLRYYILILLLRTSIYSLSK